MDDIIHEKLQHLGDLELAILVSLISEQHCLFSSTDHLSDGLRAELDSICRGTFGLRTAVVHCTPKTTVDELSEAILVDGLDSFQNAHELHVGLYHPTLTVDFHSTRRSSPSRFSSVGGNDLDDRKIADVVIATAVDTASANVQVQVLELLRTRRIFTRNAMHTAPRDFLCMVVLSQPGARLMHHLNDMFAMSHHHAEEDGLPHLDGTSSTEGHVHFTFEDVRLLRTLKSQVRITGEMAAYLHSVVVFMRNSRYVQGGVTASATRQLRAVAMALAPLHGVAFVTPSLITLATKKVYPHRLVLATAETERSLQWGSDPEAIKELLRSLTIEDVLDEILSTVDTPL